MATMAKHEKNTKAKELNCEY